MHHVLAGISKNNRLAAAYLFVGPPQANKLGDALEFAEKLGCNRKIDLIQIRPDGASLKIEQIREIQSAVRYGPAAGTYQFIIIEGADTMTPEAAGSFLKTLEEPPPKVVFILLVEREDRIIPTIESRCQKILFGEGEIAWQPSEVFKSYYEELRNISSKSIVELLDLSVRIGRENREKEGGAGIEELLYDLVFFARNELANLHLTKILLESAKNLKKKANTRLTLDVMCLRLAET